MDLDNDYFLILGEIKSKVKTARLKAFRKVIHEEIMLYFEIGQILSKKQDELGWGSKVVEKLSLDLKKEFGEKSGYSERNLKYMLKLYKTYRYDEKVQQLAAQIPWTHNCIILDSCNNNSEREFYLRLVIEKGLSRNILKIQIEGNAEINSKSLVDNNFQNTIPENSDLAQSLLKDKYLFDFLGLNDKFNEKELENKILENIKQLDELYTKLKRKNTIRIRFVIIPGVTDTKEHLHKLGEFIKSIKNLELVELLPYSTIGKSKWYEIFKQYHLEGIPEATQNDVENVKEILKLYTNKFL